MGDYYYYYSVFSSLLFIPGPKHGFWPLLLASPSSEGQMKPEASLQHTEIAFTVTPSSPSSSRYYLNKLVTLGYGLTIYVAELDL